MKEEANEETIKHFNFRQFLASSGVKHIKLREATGIKEFSFAKKIDDVGRFELAEILALASFLRLDVHDLIDKMLEEIQSIKNT